MTEIILLIAFVILSVSLFVAIFCFGMAIVKTHYMEKDLQEIASDLKKISDSITNIEKL